MFAPWRTDPHWAPPPLPRFGPPSVPTGENAQDAEQPGDQQLRERSFADDEFLR